MTNERHQAKKARSAKKHAARVQRQAKDHANLQVKKAKRDLRIEQRKADKLDREYKLEQELRNTFCPFEDCEDSLWDEINSSPRKVQRDNMGRVWHDECLKKAAKLLAEKLKENRDKIRKAADQRRAYYTTGKLPEVPVEDEAKTALIDVYDHTLTGEEVVEQFKEAAAQVGEEVDVTE